jgi:hypothetical protein
MALKVNLVNVGVDRVGSSGKSHFAFFFLICIVGCGVHTGSTRHIGHFGRTVSTPGDCEDREFGGSTRRKPVTVPLCPPQIPLDKTRARTWAAAVRSQLPAAWAVARPPFCVSYKEFMFLYNWSAFYPSPLTTDTNQFTLDADVFQGQSVSSLSTLHKKEFLYKYCGVIAQCGRW